MVGCPASKRDLDVSRQVVPKERKPIMRKLAWAALIALPFMAAGAQQASANGGFCWVGDFCRFRIKLCAQCYPKCGCAPHFGCGSCGGGWGGDACGGTFDECHGVVPGPWYTYWPYGGAPVMTSPYNYPAWVYDDNFQTQGSFPFWGR